MDVAIYARTSPEELSDGTAIERQLEVCRQYATNQGWRVVLEVRDDGCPGAVPLPDRTHGKSLLDGAEKGAFQRVLVSDRERLSHDPLVVARIEERFASRGVSVVYVEGGLNP
jgi:DNA invertase Pin-like site-specific DNA recombinase